MIFKNLVAVSACNKQVEISGCHWWKKHQRLEAENLLVSDAYHI
jgi:hypothetical protein